MDGRLEEEVWKLAADGGPLVQAVPYEGMEPTQRTAFRVIYDEESIYVGVWCYDTEPDEIVAWEMAHDGDIASDDYVGVVFDTFLDRRNGYEFRTNPNGARGESIISDNVNLNENWDGIWMAASTIDSEGWKAEIKIPFQTLSFSPVSETWGFNFFRQIRRNAEKNRWVAARPEISTHNVAEAGRLTGLKGLKQGIGLDVVPYALAGFKSDRVTSDDDLDLEAGGDARYRITPNLTAQLSYNTDFAETEVDYRQVNLTRFPLFFPEKRDFFLEDSGIFRFGGLGTNLVPFYSRRIGLSAEGEQVPILVAGKVTGRANDYNIGFLDALLDDHGNLGMKNAMVARLSRNVFEQSSLGALATYGDPNSDDENFLGGFDFGYRTTKLFGDNVLQANLFGMGTYTQGVSGDDVFSYGGNVSMPNDLYSASLQFYQVDEDFNPALGFVPRKDIRAYSSSFTYQPRPTAIDFIRQLYFTYSNSHYTDLANELETAYHSFYPLSISFESSDYVYVNITRAFDAPDEDFEISPGVVIPDGEYWWTYYRVGLDSAGKRPLELELDYSFGEFYDGEKQSYYGGFEVKPFKYLAFRAGYSLNRVNLPEGDFDTKLSSLRMQINFTPDLIWYHLFQYDNVSDTAGYNSRIVWQFQPGANLYLVFNQILDYDDSDLTLMETELTAKVGVTFRF